MYLTEEKKKYREKLKNPSQEEIDYRSYEYALFCANIKKFIPKIYKNSNTINLFKDYMYYAWISTLEQYNHEYLINTTIVNNSAINFNQIEPIIFCSFHYGSFRLLNSYLYELGHKIVIIVADDVFNKQEKDLMDNVMPMLKGTKNSDFIILNVTKRSSIFKLKELISKGYHMTVYLDGNTGINDNNQSFEKGFIPISFLNKTVYVRNGIGKLAALLKATIVPSITHRDKEENNHLTFYKAIKISDFTSKQEFALKSIETVYNIFENELINDPMQWGTWIYIHKWFKRDYTTPYNNNENPQNLFNTDRYLFFKLGTSNFLFDLIDYKSYPIEKNIYESIIQNEIEKLNSNIYKELINKNIII
ncbi:MAG TPA: hypothetical protein EYG89_04345 [Bacteroidia bacterium]|nr:hypothetical protein [Bacteroidia bacterium]